MIEEIKEFFCIQEFIDKTVFQFNGESAWKFIDDDLLKCILAVRKGLNKPMTINNWHIGGQFTQRGLRHNMSPMVKGKTVIYLSAHMFGKAVDFDVKGMSAVDVRDWIANNEHLFPCKIRLERNMKGNPISWVHLDTMSDPGKPKIYQFDV